MESIPRFLSSPCFLSSSSLLLVSYPHLSSSFPCFLSSSSSRFASILSFHPHLLVSALSFSFLSSPLLYLHSYPSFLSFHPYLLVFTLLLLLLFPTRFLSSSSPCLSLTPSLILVPPNFHPFCFCHFWDSFPPPLSLSPLLFCPCHLVLLLVSSLSSPLPILLLSSDPPLLSSPHLVSSPPLQRSITDHSLEFTHTHTRLKSSPPPRRNEVSERRWW